MWLKGHEATVWGEGVIWERQAFPSSLQLRVGVNAL